MDFMGEQQFGLAAFMVLGLEFYGTHSDPFPIYLYFIRSEALCILDFLGFPTPVLGIDLFPWQRWTYKPFERQGYT